jgi:leucyl aminopeptidase
MSSPDPFAPVPSRARLAALDVRVVATADPGAAVVGIGVAGAGEVDVALGLDRAALTAAGFAAKVGTALANPAAGTVAVGLGDDAPTAATVRDAAAAFALAAVAHGDLTFVLPDGDGATLAQAAVEGIVLARYRYDSLRKEEPEHTPLASVTIVSDAAGAAEGAARGTVLARATSMSRDLANTPHSHLSAQKLAALCVAMAEDAGLGVEVFGKEELQAMGCGGLLGVNAGSVEPPQMIVLTYVPAGDATGHLGIVGKGVMYDSGGLSLKPGNEVHAQMKNDMSGAAAVTATMAVLRELGCTTQVTAWLMCTDNMPSGTAMALGDVITIRGGTTVEVINTDAEGRLVMSDGLVLAVEAGVDAVIDIATLTGACMAALGTHVAGVMGNDDALVAQVQDASAASDESVWRLPLEQRYRPQLDSTVADMRNLGGPFAGAITAALFLAEFVGEVPWAHIDIAGVAQTPSVAGWHTAGCSGFGSRLLAELAVGFRPPSA